MFKKLFNSFRKPKQSSNEIDAAIEIIEVFIKREIDPIEAVGILEIIKAETVNMLHD